VLLHVQLLVLLPVVLEALLRAEIGEILWYDIRAHLRAGHALDGRGFRAITGRIRTDALLTTKPTKIERQGRLVRSNGSHTTEGITGTERNQAEQRGEKMHSINDIAAWN
jgi:hypothetical protein